MSKMIAYIKQFEYYKGLADQSIARMSDNQLHALSTIGSNSIAIIMKHMAGNMLSRWTDIFTTDGEKTWRNREDEFVDTYFNRSELEGYWDQAWDRLFSTLDDLSDDNLDQIVYIRNMGCTVHDAIIRQLCHYSYHVGQIAFIAKAQKGTAFESLSIPLGESGTYNEKRFDRPTAIKHFTDDLE